MTFRDRALYVFILLVAVSVILGTGIIRAFSHDWYPMECCSGLDCAPVIKAEIVPGPVGIVNSLLPATGTMVVTTIHGSVVVPATFPRRASLDGRMHACMTKRHDAIDSMRLICIFMPPGS